MLVEALRERQRAAVELDREIAIAHDLVHESGSIEPVDDVGKFGSETRARSERLVELLVGDELEHRIREGVEPVVVPDDLLHAELSKGLHVAALEGIPQGRGALVGGGRGALVGGALLRRAQAALLVALAAAAGARVVAENHPNSPFLTAAAATCGMSDAAGIIVEDFHARCEKLAFTRPKACVFCAGGLVFNGFSIRSASMIVDDDVRYIPEILQRRLLCKRCNTRVLLRPPELLPRVHYQACVLTSAVVELAQGATTVDVAEHHGCDRRSVRRFVARIAATGEPHVVASEVAAVVDEPVIPKIELAERAFPLAPATMRDLRCAHALLVLVEALGSARGEEPRVLRPFMRAASPCPTMPSEFVSRADPRFSDGRRPQPP